MSPDRAGLGGLHHQLVLQALRWREARPRYSGGPPLWSPAHPGGPFLSLLARFPAVARAAGPALSVLRHEHPDQYHYPVDQVHVTLLNLDHLAADPDEAVRTVTRVYESITSTATPLHLTLGRMQASRQTVYCPAVETTGQLRDVRRRLRTATGLRNRHRPGAVDDLVFVNMVRFRVPLDRRTLHRRLRQLPSTSGLEMDVGPAELVLTDKVLSATATQRLLSLPS